MSGWGYTLTPYTAEELVEWEAHERLLNEREGGREWLAARGHDFWMECSAPKCKARPVFHASWRYVTGRAGRVSSTQKHYCRDHGDKFAEKHGLTIEATA